MEHESAVNLLKKPSRNYGIDALRIVSMLLIVILHILNVGGVLESSTSVSHSAAWFLDVACFCAVNCYALISGYVGIFSKYKISNFALLWCRVALYSASITIIYKCFMPDRVRLKDII
ncbi:MAG: hypothetical protein J5766_04525, partial [Clostridia bacterium]|nr:hypothetical protein [Clostridia bacterium]